MPLVRKDPPQAPAPGAATDKGAAARLRAGAPNERWSAARSLGGDRAAVRALGEALESEDDPRVREAIFTSLALTGGDEAVSVVLPHLRSPEADVRTAALDALRAMPQAAAPRLGELLGDADRDVRLLSCELARHLPPAEAGRLLGDLLQREPDANVCGAAVDVLAEVAGPDVLPALAACAERFPEEAFLQFALKAASDRIGAPPRG